MEKEKLAVYFKEHYEEAKQMVIRIAMWSDKPDREACEMLAKGLTILARDGDKNAAALYCLITAFDNNADAFSADTAWQLVFELEAVDVYHDLLYEELDEIVDEKRYSQMYSFPIAKAFACIVEKTEPKGD